MKRRREPRQIESAGVNARRALECGERDSDATPVFLLTRNHIRCLVDLATDIEFSEAAVTALYEAIRGEVHPAQELLRSHWRAGRAGSSPAAHLFRRDCDYWTIMYEGHVLRLRDTKGLRYLARLLHQPGEPAHVAELAGVVRAATNRADLERARLAVTKAMKAALARIEVAHPELGRHLAATVHRGYACVYRPDPRAPIAWGA